MILSSFLAFLWRIRFFFERILNIKRDPSVIPQNISYCYTPLGYDNEKSILHIQCCPYFKNLGNDYAVCKYEKYANDDSLLWDQCKICDISHYEIPD